MLTTPLHTLLDHSAPGAVFSAEGKPMVGSTLYLLDLQSLKTTEIRCCHMAMLSTGGSALKRWAQGMLDSECALMRLLHLGIERREQRACGSFLELCQLFYWNRSLRIHMLLMTVTEKTTGLHDAD